MLLLAPALSACGLGSALGLGKRSPDEFAVVKRQPLVVPPDYNLRPPRPGAPRPQTGTTGDQARAALTGQPVDPAASRSAGLAVEPAGDGGASAGEAALLARANAGEGATDPGIRARIADDSGTPAAVDAALLTRLLEWNAGTEAGATTADGAPTVLRRTRTRLQDLEEEAP